MRRKREGKERGKRRKREEKKERRKEERAQCNLFSLSTQYWCAQLPSYDFSFR